MSLFSSVSLRDSLISNISDDSKTVYGCRLRLDWNSYNLVDLWYMAKHMYSQACVSFDDYDCWEADKAADDAYYAKMEAEDRVWDEIKPTVWDEIADKLEGIPC